MRRIGLGEPGKVRSGCLAGRPGHLSLAQNVQVNVVDRLTTVGVAVEHCTETVLATLLAGYLLTDEDHMADQCAVVFGHVTDDGDMPFRDDQKMHWCLGVDVIEGNDLLIFIDFCRRDLALDDLAEQTVHALLLGWIPDGFQCNHLCVEWHHIELLQKDSLVKNDIHDLGLLLDSRVKLIITESWEEQRVLETMAALAVKRARTWFTWDHVDGLKRLGFGEEIDDTDTWDPEKALQCARRDKQQSIYVFCDLHPFMENPKVVRLLKLLAMNHDQQAPTVLLVSHQLKLPAELSRLSARLELSMPSDEELSAIIREEAAHWTEQNRGLKVRTDNRTLEQVVRNLRGTTHAEARRLARKLIADDGAITQEDVPELNKAKFSLLDMQGVLSFEQNTAHFGDVAGLHHFKRWLMERQAAFVSTGAIADAPKGVMLVGVQGAGKSLAAKAVAGVWGLPLLRLDFAALYNKYIGETEKNLREALQMADCMAPCVLWIDEIEKGVAPDGHDQGVSRRLLGTLLTWMSERQSRVFLVATANDVSQLPPELIRKGRLDEMFFIDLPDAGVREEILRIHLQKRDLQVAGFDLPALALACEGFSGAEIEQAVVAAVYAASARQQGVTDAHLQAALAQTSPLSVVMAERLQALRAWGQERAVMAG